MKTSTTRLFKSLLATALFISFSAHAQQCDLTPNPNAFSFSFTAYGAPDKSYVVSKNTFKQYSLASENKKLLNASIDINAFSVDTSHDLNNGSGGQWPIAFSSIRNSNIVNGLFKRFEDAGHIKARITGINKTAIELNVEMNGVTHTIPMTYTIKDGVLHAKGVLDILDFNGKTAFEAFAAICADAWHKGKSWSDVAIEFSVQVNEPSC